MTDDHMQIRATAIVNDLTGVTDPPGALDVLTLGIYLVMVMAAQDDEDANDMYEAVMQCLGNRMQNYPKDRETFLRTRGGKSKAKAKQERLIKAMLALGMGDKT